jgi:hypothetical protein
MVSKKLAFLIVAFFTAAALPALAQGGGGGGGAGGAGGGAGSAGVGGSAGGSAAGGPGTGGTASSGSAIGAAANGGTTGNNNSQINSQTPTTAAPAGSPTAVQANRNSGAGPPTMAPQSDRLVLVSAPLSTRWTRIGNDDRPPSPAECAKL